ncbi:DUF1493 family protein [Pantoea agglomerans]|jgi:hypothetical protein|uniref:DUF1493 family protein n=1 Tax=Enterobacter agglomerans TaxID=549 RepID=UPI003C7B53A7
MSKVEDVHRLIKKYFWEMPDDASLSTGKNCVLAEEAFDFFEEYAELFNVDMKRFYFRLYFPATVIPFLPNAILPKYLRTDHHQPEPLTVQMLIDSAKAREWLY